MAVFPGVGEGAADVFLETERKDLVVFSPEEHKRAVELYLTTSMTAAEVVEHLGYPTRQCLERRLVKDPRHAGRMRNPHHPHGNQAEGDRTGIGRHAAEASRPAARRERGRRGPFWVKTYREGGMAALPPENRNAARRTAGRRRSRGVTTPPAMTVTWRRCTAGSGNWSWGTRWCGRCSR